jgi:SAM-dependent methyltransferase
MSKAFYNKVASKFGRYHTAAKYEKIFSNGVPEADFLKYLLSYGNSEADVLDVGCADGRFSTRVAPNFKTLTAVDYSKSMIRSAKELQKEAKIPNLIFEEHDASKLPYAAESFDLIYSRRGPDFYQEFWRLLSNKGYFVAIGIGELDARDIKEVFGRGQGYGDEGISQSGLMASDLKEHGFSVVSSKDYQYYEVYPTRDDLDLFLQGVPIFEDYVPVADAELLDEYILSNTVSGGIKLPRHRFVLVAQKLRGKHNNEN